MSTRSSRQRHISVVCEKGVMVFQRCSDEPRRYKSNWFELCSNIVNRGTGYETLKPSKARTILSQSMLNRP